IISLCLITLSGVCFAQLIPNGSFENGTIPSSTGSGETLDPATALPGWSILGSPLYFQYGPLGGPVISLTPTTSFPASNGTNSVYLQAGFGGATNPVSLWRSLSVPLNVNAITFQSRALYDPNLYPAGYYLPLLVSAAGLSVTPTYLSTDASGYQTLGIDVSPYLGTSMELRFSIMLSGETWPFGGGGGAWQIDNIRYSTNPVPEPDVLTLLSVGAVMLGLQYCRKKTHARLRLP
ncbi:MAG: hypothetical protein WCJ07_07180, partial [Verrucomicrobiota bacterium]